MNSTAVRFSVASGPSFVACMFLGLYPLFVGLGTSGGCLRRSEAGGICGTISSRCCGGGGLTRLGGGRGVWGVRPGGGGGAPAEVRGGRWGGGPRSRAWGAALAAGGGGR